ncbi:PadR family transcriptional regulator [Pseudochryseolinea flava]|uniref:PadR family transcriptional regulator n=1 Tax=Pseudochryseolinea flava TaxID=2059302 RepID=A0A364Y7E2_9BACT|nr:PadR family transcriptional regulator [Pseudochryseolinea flava]RAW02860.1 PadR family transcriptional regulator [Pseudochryseolinea flava]
MAREFLNEFEELVLTSVAVLEDDAYGAAITLELEKWLERKVTLSAVHVSLYKLEDKGYLKSKVGGATNERGGRSKRIYTITNAGTAVLRAMREKRVELWGMMPQFKTI